MKSILRQQWGNPALLTLCLLATASIEVAQAHLPRYAPVASARTRSTLPNYVRLPGWEAIAVVRDGTIDQSLMHQIDVSQLNAQIDLKRLRWLMVRELDIDRDNVLVNTGEAGIPYSLGTMFIPFAVSLRYQENGLFSQVFRQGTLNARGLISLIRGKDGVLEIDIVSFDDSQWIERLGRRLGIIDQYDGGFVVGVVRPILRQYFSQAQNVERLLIAAEIPDGRRTQLLRPRF